MHVTGIRDLSATELNVVGDRGERDYFDLIILERDAGVRVEEGLTVFVNPLHAGGGGDSHCARTRIFLGCRRRPRASSGTPRHRGVSDLPPTGNRGLGAGSPGSKGIKAVEARS